MLQPHRQPLDVLDGGSGGYVSYERRWPKIATSLTSDLMHVEFDISWWSTKLWWRRKWRRTLIRFHLAKPYDELHTVFGTIKLTYNLLPYQLFEQINRIDDQTDPQKQDAYADEVMTEFMALSTKKIAKMKM